MASSRRLSDFRRRLEQARRTRLLHRAPERATWPEVEELMSRELPLRAVLDVCLRAHGRDIRPATMWPWIQRHGAPLLALVVAAGMDDADLRRHLSGVEALDVESLEMHAELNGNPVHLIKHHRSQRTHRPGLRHV